jgi:hypothetical protein
MGASQTNSKQTNKQINKQTKKKHATSSVAPRISMLSALLGPEPRFAFAPMQRLWDASDKAILNE